MKYEIIFTAIPDTTYHVDLSMMDTRTPDEYAHDATAAAPVQFIVWYYI